MAEDSTTAAVKATAQEITNDDAKAAEMGMDAIPPDEVIAEPNPSEYVAPPYLDKTVPQLAGAFGELLGALRDLNAHFAGDRTVEVQAYLSLTGEHEELEERFLGWCQKYFGIRGSLERLNPTNEGDPWRLFVDCYGEFNKLLERRLVQPGTINSSVLNLSQRFMQSSFAAQVLLPDLTSHAKSGRDRFGSESHREQAKHALIDFSEHSHSFDSFLKLVAQNLPNDDMPDASPDWYTGVQARITHLAEDLSFLRYLLCVLDVPADKQQIAPDLWARFRWDVYHGKVIGSVLTSSTSEPTTERSTRHLIGVRRDGWLCHREYAWLRVDPKYKVDERRHEFAVNLFVLDALTAPLYDAWLRLDPEPVVNRGLEPDATEEQQTAALVVALAELDTEKEPAPITKQPLLPRLRLMRIKLILTRNFGCEWSMAKGSEQKVFRPGGKLFTFGCHASDRSVNPSQLRSCLRKLGIPFSDFLAACR